MHRIDTPTAQPDKFGPGKNGFTGGNPQTGQLPTALDQDFFDALQEEIARVVEGAGLELDKQNHGQMLVALGMMFASKDSVDGKQPLSDTLTILASLMAGANKLPYFTGNDTAAVTDLTAIGRNIIGKGSIADVLSYLGLGDGSSLPVGVPVPYPLAVPPAGWMKCNGSPFNLTSYPALAAVFPSGVLPDLRGEFIRGWDDGRGIDTGRNLLTHQGDAIRNITGQIGQLNDRVTEGLTTGAFKIATGYSQLAGLSGGGTGRVVSFDASNVVPVAGENRPRNIAFNYIVRAA
ncbi:tail fiber protein [Cronobacter sakazakii]|nr:tail fiber protein [Cronobacter sakazakii]